MAKIKCDECGHVINWEETSIVPSIITCLDQQVCEKCGGGFTLLSDVEAKKVVRDQEAKRIIQLSEDESSCNEIICHECDCEISEEDIIKFEESGIEVCKSCIDRAYPREKEFVETIVEKYVDTSKDKTEPISIKEKSRFD